VTFCCTDKIFLPGLRCKIVLVCGITTLVMFTITRRPLVSSSLSVVKALLVMVEFLLVV